LLAIFASVALLLAAVGVYGLVAYSVSQRTREIGLRAALGAGAKDILSLIAQQGLGLTLSGVSLGLALAALLTPAMRGLLYGVSARDPLVLGGLTVFMAVVSLAATIHPALRATRMTPAEALRHE